LRFYFGQKDKTLIQRHRQDDPIEWVPETLFSIVNNGTTLPPVVTFNCDNTDAEQQFTNFVSVDGCDETR
jgi:hypothetical protein